MQRPPCGNMRYGREQCGTDQAGEGAIRLLQARIELLKSKTLACEETVEGSAFAGEVLVDFRLHCLRIGARKHRLVGEIQGVHRIEPLELQVVARTAASFNKQLIEQKLHHQERRPEIETILTEVEFCVTSTDDILFLEDLNAESALGKKHRGSKPTRPGSHDHDVSLFIALLKAHSPTIGSSRMTPAGVELTKCNHLLHVQRSWF